VCDGCGTVWTNAVIVSGNDCCACTLQSSASVITNVDCPVPEVGIESTRAMVPGGPWEVCQDTQGLTSSYTFTGSAWNSIRWDAGGGNLRFTEEKENYLDYIDGTLSVTVNPGTAGECTPVFAIVDPPVTAAEALVVNITDEGGCAENIGENTVLEISYDLRPTADSQPQCRSSEAFIDYASLEVFDITGVFGAGDAFCPGPGGGIVVRDADQFVNTGSEMNVSISDLGVGDCRTSDPVTLTINRTSTEPAYNVMLFMETDDYARIRVIGASPAPSNGLDGTPVTAAWTVAATPAETVGYVWTYNDTDFDDPGDTATIRLEVQQYCRDNPQLNVRLAYDDGCGILPPPIGNVLDPNERNCEDTAAAGGIHRDPDLRVVKFPEVVFAEVDPGTGQYASAQWKIKVINSGAGSAYNVEVIELLGDNLAYASAIWDGVYPDITQFTNLMPDNATVINGASFVIEEMPPAPPGR
jgi:hypothetical protein